MDLLEDIFLQFGKRARDMNLFSRLKEIIAVVFLGNIGLDSVGSSRFTKFPFLGSGEQNSNPNVNLPPTSGENFGR